MAAEIDHLYGDHVHILSDPYLNAVLMQVCHQQTRQPLLNRLVEFLYEGLLHSVLGREIPVSTVRSETRMTADHPTQFYQGQVINPEQSTVVVNLARAGTWPSAICYDRLNYVLNPERVRQDHIMAARQLGTVGEVTGAHLSATKVGGSVDGAVVLFPDPMGATGSTLRKALTYYKDEVPGIPLKSIGMHLIVTPEYIRELKNSYPSFIIYALRVDRGLSSPKALGARPGTYWQEEKGLDARQYIVPAQI
jgi:uracil phosphoribosyltransferase